MSTPTRVAVEDYTKDAAFSHTLHGSSVQAKGGLQAMLKKNQGAQKAAIEEYLSYWDDDTTSDVSPESEQVR